MIVIIKNSKIVHTLAYELLKNRKILNVNL
jgi:hypothetical protein